MEYKEIEVEYLTYTTIQGDTWDSIAIDFYGNPNLSYVIINANLLYSEYVILDGGMELKIPIIPDNLSTTTLPPWKVTT